MKHEDAREVLTLIDNYKNARPRRKMLAPPRERISRSTQLTRPVGFAGSELVEESDDSSAYAADGFSSGEHADSELDCSSNDFVDTYRTFILLYNCISISLLHAFHVRFCISFPTFTLRFHLLLLWFLRMTANEILL